MSEPLKRGDVVEHPDFGGECRVMAVADGYAMLRRPGCLPFVLPVKKLPPAAPTEGER